MHRIKLCVRVFVWPAQYRVATSDLTEALEFFKTVHADELLGYDGDSVRHIVGTLRASRPHLYPSTSDVFSYNATPPHNHSLSVPVVADFRPSLGNESDAPPTAMDAATAEGRKGVVSAINQIGTRSDLGDTGGSEATTSSGRRSPDRRRRQAVEEDETTEGKQLLSSKRSSAQDNEIIGYVVVQDDNREEMTSGRGYDEDDEDEENESEDEDEGEGED